jgi:hypothetical protein
MDQGSRRLHTIPLCILHVNIEDGSVVQYLPERKSPGGTIFSTVGVDRSEG